MPIDLNAMKAAADAKTAKQKGRLQTMNEISDATTNIKNRSLSALSNLSDTIKAYLEGCGLLVSDTLAYQLYLNVYLLDDSSLEELTYYYTLTKIDKKTGTKITYYKDNVSTANGTSADVDVLKRTGWSYSSTTATEPDAYVFTSGLKEFLNLIRVTEEEVNTAINIGLNMNSEAISKLGTHPFFYFKTSRTKDVMGDDELTYSQLPTYDEVIDLLIARVKRITKFISGIEEQRGNIQRILDNAIAGKPITPACYTIESEVINTVTKKTETITISAFDVARTMDTKVLSKPYDILCSTELTSEVTLIDAKDNEMTIPAGTSFRDWCYIRFEKTLSPTIIGETISDCEKSASSGFASLFSMASLKTVSNALSSFATKALEAAKAKALAQMASSVNSYVVSKADSALLENKLMSQAADIATGNTNVVANTAYLVSTFKSMKEDNPESCKNLELLSDSKTFVEKKYDFIGSYVCHFGDSSSGIFVTVDVTSKLLNMYTFNNTGLTLTKSLPYDTYEYFKITKTSGIITINTNSTSTVSKWIRIDTELTPDVNPIIKSSETYTDKEVVIHHTDIIGILKIVSDDIYLVTKYQKYGEKEYRLGVSKINFKSKEMASMIYELRSDIMEVVSGLDISIMKDYEIANRNAGGVYTLPIGDEAIPYNKVSISTNLFHFMLKLKDVGHERLYKIPITNIISYINKEIGKLTVTNESIVLFETEKYDYVKGKNFNYDVVNKKLLYIKDDTLATESVDITVDSGYIIKDIDSSEEYVKIIDGKKSFNYISKKIDDTYFILGEPCIENTLKGLYVLGNVESINKQLDGYGSIKSSTDSALNATATNIDNMLDTKTSSLVSSGSESGLTTVANNINGTAANAAANINISIDLTSEATEVTLDMITLYDISNAWDGCDTHEQLHQDIYDALLKKEAKSCSVDANTVRKYFIKTWYNPV